MVCQLSKELNGEYFKRISKSMNIWLRRQVLQTYDNGKRPS